MDYAFVRIIQCVSAAQGHLFYQMHFIFIFILLIETQLIASELELRARRWNPSVMSGTPRLAKFDTPDADVRGSPLSARRDDIRGPDTAGGRRCRLALNFCGVSSARSRDSELGDSVDLALNRILSIWSPRLKRAGLSAGIFVCFS